MIDHPHAKLARTAWEAAATGDRDTLARACAPDVLWHASGRGPRSGDYRGIDCVLDYLAAIGDAAERFDMHFDDVLVGLDRAAVLFHVSGTRHGRQLDTDFLLMLRIEDGQIAEIWAVPLDQYAIDEFWA